MSISALSTVIRTLNELEGGGASKCATMWSRWIFMTMVLCDGCDTKQRPCHPIIPNCAYFWIDEMKIHLDHICAHLQVPAACRTVSIRIIVDNAEMVTEVWVRRACVLHDFKMTYSGWQLPARSSFSLTFMSLHWMSLCFVLEQCQWVAKFMSALVLSLTTCRLKLTFSTWILVKCARSDTVVPICAPSFVFLENMLTFMSISLIEILTSGWYQFAGELMK